MDSLCINALCFSAGATFIYLLGLLDKLLPSRPLFGVPRSRKYLTKAQLDAVLNHIIEDEKEGSDDNKST